MKRKLFYTFIVMLLWGFQVLGQSLVNGDMESWTGDTPDGWTIADNITPATDIVHGGSYAAKHTSASGSKKLRQNIEGVVGGTEYTISYWYYDNDPAARTRIWAYWMADGNTLDDNADELRPNTYSEDNDAWQQFSVTLTAPPTANQFRFEVRVYKQDGNTGGAVYYDDFSFSGDVTIDPEPSEYPLNFTAQVEGNAVHVSYTDAGGEQAPLGYILYASTSSDLPTPEDGTPVEDDLDFSDGSGAVNVPYGASGYTFENLQAATTYYFTIYPYTNTGENIDYKTDGTAPTAQATTLDIITVFNQDFENGFGDWTTYSVAGDQEWSIVSYGNPGECAKMTGYDSGTTYANEDWLISPAFNLDDITSEVLTFETAMNYNGNAIEVFISDEYTSGDPNEADWQPLTATLSSGSWEWTPSGNIDLSVYSGTNVHIAFKFTCDESGSATWEVDNVKLIAEDASSILPEPTNYPTDFAGTADITTMNLTWTDATGEQLPEAYLIVAYTSSFGGVADGQPIGDDLDSSDGFAALNVPYGQEAANFAGAMENTTYTLEIYPYTNSGTDIDYKNSPGAPQISITTGESNIMTIFNQDFENGFGDWTTYSVTGDEQVWEIVSYGNPGECAKMTGYQSGTTYANEDWLISPSVNLNDYTGEILSFETSMNYTGPALEAYYSVDYTSGDPTAATWVSLDFTPSSGSWEWTPSGNIDLSNISGTNVHIAFKFTCDESGSATWEVDNVLLEGIPSGIPENHTLAYDIFPNPAQGTCYLANASGESLSVHIYSLTGKEVYATTVENALSRIDLPLDAGIYLVRITGKRSAETSVQKLIVR